MQRQGTSTWRRLLGEQHGFWIAAVAVVVATVLAVGAVAALRLWPDGDEADEAVPRAPHEVSLRVAPHIDKPVAVSKALTILIENHNINQMFAQMPYLSWVAHQYSYADHYTGIRHPSLPNYLSLAGGSTFGVTDDKLPSSHPISGPSVFGEAVAQGRTARAYMDEMSQNCELSNHDTYAARHNPWAYFTDERSLCDQFDVPIDSARKGRLHDDIAAGRLPNVGMLIPDTCNDAHDHKCTLARADHWLRSWLPQIFDGPDFRSGHLAVVITADEDDHHLGNRVLTVVAHPSLHGVVVTSPLTHFSLSGFMSQVSGAAPLREAAAAPSFATAFGLATRH